MAAVCDDDETRRLLWPSSYLCCGIPLHELKFCTKKGNGKTCSGVVDQHALCVVDGGGDRKATENLNF